VIGIELAYLRRTNSEADMKVLIGYNGSEAATAALDGFALAGLPDDVQVLVLTVAESWLPPQTVASATEMADKAVSIIAKTHPGFHVSKRVSTGCPATELLAAAATFHPDLIIVGEPEREGGHGLFLGHTSQKIVTESRCSVRIARPSNQRWTKPARLVVGFDGSVGAIDSIRTISKRTWPPGTEVCLVAIADASVLGAIGRFTPQMKDAAVGAKFASQWAETLAASSLDELRRAGVNPRVEVRFGNPKDELVRYANEWKADTIFVGPHCAANSFERFLLGSVSAAVAARANCAVEVVRIRNSAFNAKNGSLPKAA